MSNAAKVLLAKYALTFLLGLVSFNLVDRSPWGWVFAVGITAATLNYLLGDFYVLPKIGNTAASVLNGVLSGLAAYFVNFFIPVFKISSVELLLFVILTALGEYIFHRYLMRSEEVRP